MYKAIFENDKLIVVSKEQGVVVQPDENDKTCLLYEVQHDFGSEDIRLCHRLDRNTGGIVILAKNEETYNAVVSLMDENQIVKTYSALCFGNVKQEKKARDGFTTLKAYHFKDAKKGMVYIYDFPKKYCKEIITKYRTVSYDVKKNVSRLEIELVTGRTHQIRAQFAHLGHPVCGDGKYGKNAQNKTVGFKYQALWAEKVSFSKKACELLGTPGVLTDTPRFI